jgi:catecholate siderophore receptor
MSSKVPVSLRRPNGVSRSEFVREKSSSTAVGMITAACIASGMSVTNAHAQTTTPGQLPSLTVEAPAEVQKKKPQSRPATRRSSTSRSTGTRPPTGPSSTAGDAAATPRAANANPNADPSAPYKVDRSANTKLTQPILDTARSITTIPKEVIQDKAATSFVELARTMPGVTLGTGEGGNSFGDRLIIRGFDTRNDVFIDGVRDPGVAIRENFGTEQVEILKGPSSTVGGRGTAGAAVNVVTKKPSFDKNFGELSTMLGTDNTTRFTTDVNQIISPQFAVRANGMWQEADVAGRDYVFDNRWGGLLAATWKPTNQLKVTVDHYHLDLDQLPDWGVPSHPTAKRPITEFGVDRSNFYGIPSRDFQRSKQDISTATTEIEFNEAVKMTNKSRFGYTLMDYVAGAPEGANVSAGTVRSNPKSRFQETQIAANQTDFTLKFDTGVIKHTAVIGGEISRESMERDTYTGLATEAFGVISTAGPLLNLWNPNVEAVRTIGGPSLTGRPTDIVVSTKSTYVLDTLNYNDWLFVNGGLRLDDYNISSASAATGELTRHDTLLNYNAGITYKPVPYGSLYVAYGTSSTPMGSDLDASASDYGGLVAANATLGPEKNTSAEIGSKWELFDRHLLLTAAFFQNEKTGARENLTVGGVTTVTATGSYLIRGIELGLSGNITPKWSVYGGVVLMDSEVTESNTASNVGLKLANVAHQSFSLLTKYKLTDYLTVGGQATYKSEVLGGTFSANTGAVLPDSWRFDLLAEYEVNKWLTAKVNVNNIFDEVIYDAFYRSQAPFAYLAPGRVAYLTLTAKY